MHSCSSRTSYRTPALAWIAWGLASLLILFFAENLWIDPWLRHKSHRIPSLVPEAASGAWLAALILGGMVLILLVVCWILLLKGRELSLTAKAGTGIAVLVALLLSMQWVLVTTGQPGLRHLFISHKSQSVVLSWRASSSPVIGYNVYRKSSAGDNYHRLNSVPVQELTFTDSSVESGMTYFYMTRAVDTSGAESANSNEFSVTLP